MFLYSRIIKIFIFFDKGHILKWNLMRSCFHQVELLEARNKKKKNHISAISHWNFKFDIKKQNREDLC